MGPSHMLLALPLLVPVAAAQTVCDGWTLDEGSTPADWPGYGLALNGAYTATFLSGPYVTTGGLGGASIHRVTADDAGLALEGVALVLGAGTGFAAYGVGVALGSSGAVLVGRKTALPGVAEFVQLRRGASGAWVGTSFAATGTMATAKSRRFDADGDLAVMTTRVPGPPGSGFVALDLLTLDGAGDWYVEDTVRAPGVFISYLVLDVTLRGETVALRLARPWPNVFAWERAAPGRWEPLPLPPAFAAEEPFEVVLENDTLLATYFDGNGGRLELWDRQPSGGWTLGLTLQTPTAVSGAPRLPQLAGDFFAYGTSATEGILRRRTGVASSVVQGTTWGPILRLGERYTIVSAPYRPVVVPTSDLVGPVDLCSTRGSAVCDGQRAGALRYTLRTATQRRRLLLTDGVPGAFAFTIGSTDFTPVAGALDSLCVGGAGVRVRFPQVKRIGMGGSAAWLVHPNQLPVSGGGTVSGIGSTFVFQSVVRTHAGAATTDAIAVSF